MDLYKPGYKQSEIAVAVTGMDETCIFSQL